MACVSGCIGGAGNLTHGEKNKAAKLLCRLFLAKGCDHAVGTYMRAPFSD
jgi:hypothetical protein